MDRNFIFAILLSTLIIIIYASPHYQKRFGKDVPKRPISTEQSVSRDETSKPSLREPAQVTASSQETGTAGNDTINNATSVDTIYAQVDVPPVADDVVLSNSNISVVISPRGALITSVVLSEFNGSEPGKPVQLVAEGESWYNGVIKTAETVVPYDELIFAIEKSDGESAVFTANLAGERKIKRSFTLDPEGYLIHASTDIDGPWDEATLEFGWHGPINDTEIAFKQLKIWPFSMFMRDDRFAYQKLVYLGDGTRSTVINGVEKTKEGGKRIFPKEDHSQKIDAKKPGEGSDSFIGDLDWYAVRNKYFITIAIPKEKGRWSAESQYMNTGSQKWFDFSLIKRNTDGNTDIDIYCGPISYFTLKNYGSDLTEAMELSFRFIRPISIGFLWLFKKLQLFISNWGIVIILFSIIIKIVLYPLSKTSFESMHRMSALQPQITELREKYKNNPQMLQKATMELYKKEGVNPFGGCLPTLFQLPVFLALYPVVGRAFELRQAMFIPNWIEDLSLPDPFYILPVAMGISMFFQSKATMKDPNQKAMLYIMPFMMVILFANFSSGLTLYWFLFNIMTFLQQKIHRK